MDWQAVAAILISLLCGTWVAHHWLRPLWQRRGPACTLCSECSSQCAGQCGLGESGEELLRVSQVEPAPPGGGSVHGLQHTTD